MTEPKSLSNVPAEGGLSVKSPCAWEQSVTSDKVFEKGRDCLHQWCCSAVLQPPVGI